MDRNSSFLDLNIGKSVVVLPVNRYAFPKYFLKFFVFTYQDIWNLASIPKSTSEIDRELLNTRITG